MENCWLFGLPDLDQDNEFVREGLCDWIDWILTEYDIDGMRIDSETCKKSVLLDQNNESILKRNVNVL